MSEQKRFFNTAPITPQAIFAALSLAMVFVSIYLTHHYFEYKYPTGLAASGLCNISSFFNCDVATASPLSNFFGVPISMFGIIVGAFGLFGFMFTNPNFEKTLVFIHSVNVVGCTLLFLYSLIVLGGLCPFCTVYYILSFISFFILYKHLKIQMPTLGFLSLFVIVALVASSISLYSVSEKEKSIQKMASSLISQFNSLPNLGSPKTASSFRLVSSSEKFEDAPIQVTKFSDFECPACKALSEILHKLANQYKDKINIQYFFYPLDHNCNPEMQRPLHQNACQAAYLAACLPNKFPEIEKELFDNQASLSPNWLEKIAKRENVLECYKDSKTKEVVQASFEAAKPFNIKSTPTFILNGIKIEGVLPAAQLKILFDEIIRKSK